MYGHQLLQLPQQPLAAQLTQSRPSEQLRKAHPPRPGHHSTQSRSRRLGRRLGSIPFVRAVAPLWLGQWGGVGEGQSGDKQELNIPLSPWCP